MLPILGSDDDTIPPDYSLNKFYAVCVRVFKQVYGFDLNLALRLPEELQRQGFVNVQRKVFHLPIGDWPRNPNMRTVGNYFREVFMSFATAMAARPFVEFGMEKPEIDEMLNAIRDALRDRRIHAYMPLHFVWAQKPPA